MIYLDDLTKDCHDWHCVVAPRSVDLLDYALRFAMEAHKGQVRKYTRDPYIVHPAAVARLIGDVYPDVEMIAAAYLHDVVEDCEHITIADITREFGGRVARLVAGLTDVSKPEDGNRAARKAIDREHTLKSNSEVIAIKLCDLIDNTSSITEHDPDFAVVYMKEKRLLLIEMGKRRLVPAYAERLYNAAMDTVVEFAMKREGTLRTK